MFKCLTEEETDSLYTCICKNLELKDQLNGMYKYEAADITYHVSLCKRYIKSWFSFAQYSRILLYLAVEKNLIDIEVGFIEIDNIKMTRINDQETIRVNFHHFLSDIPSKQKIVLLKNTFLNTNFVFYDQKIIFYRLEEQFTIWLDDKQQQQKSREQFIIWKCLIAKYFPYTGLPANTINHKELFTDLLNRYKESITITEVIQSTPYFTDGWPKNKIIEILLKELQDKNKIISTQRQNKKEQDNFELIINKYELKLKQAKDAIDNLSKKLEESVKMCETLEKQNNEIKIKLNKESQLKIQAEKQIQRINQINKKAESTIQQLKEKFDQKELKQNKMNLELEQYLHIFEGQVLKNCICEKQYLRSEIEKYTGKQVLMTNLLYRCDPLNKTNFHVYIDGHPHLALLLRLKNKRLIAGYSIGPIIENTSTTEGGLILSLTVQKSFELLPGKMSVIYGASLLIFGNSELRLCPLDMKLFTNFGIKSSYYNHRGEKHTVLTGGESTCREEDLDTYEIFEIIFRKT